MPALRRIGPMLTATALQVVTLVLVACGGDSSGASITADPSADVVVEAKAGNRFDKKAYSATAGIVKFELINRDSILHDIKIEGNDGFKVSADSGKRTALGSVDLAAGTYRLYCSVPGHRAGGMEAELVVAP